MGCSVPPTPNEPSPPAAPVRVLMLTATAGFRHDSLDTAVQVMNTMAGSGSFAVTVIDDVSGIDATRLAGHDVLFFALTTGELPLTVFADYAVNTEADESDTGFALGGSVGEITGPRTWRIGYAYQDLEADAVIGTFTDSDWAGGGTDGKCHVVELNYGFRDRLVFGLRYFLNDRGEDAGNGSRGNTSSTAPLSSFLRSFSTSAS